jgi:hypothetical protein
MLATLSLRSSSENILQISSFYLFDVDAVKDLFPFDVGGGTKWKAVQKKRKYLIVEK